MVEENTGSVAVEECSITEYKGSKYICHDGKMFPANANIDVVKDKYKVLEYPKDKYTVTEEGYHIYGVYGIDGTLWYEE